MREASIYINYDNKNNANYDTVLYHTNDLNRVISFCYNAEIQDNGINICFIENNKAVNGFKMLASTPEIARFYMGRPQPSKRATEVAILAIMGYEKIKFRYKIINKNIFDIDLMLFRLLKEKYKCLFECDNAIIKMINRIYFPEREIIKGNFSYVTYFSGRYIIGAYALCLSLRKFTNTKIIILYSENDDLSLFDGIKNIQFIKCSKIKNSYTKTRRRFEDVMTKLNIFTILNYDKLVYIDSDCVVNRDIEFLFSLPEGFYACPDWGLDYRTDFNSGMLVYTPSEKLKKYIFSNINKISSSDGGDQGFLNVLFKNKVVLLPPEFNTLKRVYIEHPNILNIKDAFIIHFVGEKPWDFHVLEKFEGLNRYWYKNLDVHGFIYLSHMSKMFISRRSKTYKCNTGTIKKVLMYPLKFMAFIRNKLKNIFD